MSKHFEGLDDVISFLDSDGIDYSNTDLHKIKNTANNDGVRYSVKHPVFTEKDIENNLIALSSMNSVYNVHESKLKKSGLKPGQIFENFFNSLNNNIYSEVFGDISLKKSSVKSEIRHGVTAEKIASIEAIPSVIEKGKVVFFKNKPESDVYRIVVAAPIKIGSQSYYMGVMLQRDTQNQRLYLHNVVIEKETSLNSQADLLTTGALENNEHLFITTILQKAIDVKKNAKNSEIKNTQRDTTYLEAINNGDMETAQRMVDEVAKEKVYNIKAYHGTRKADFTVFRRNVNYFTSNPDVAQSYAPNNETYSVYLKMQNPFVLDAKNSKWSKIPISNDLIALFDTYGSSYFTEDGAIRSSVADIVAVIEDAVDDGEFDYDGVIIKNVDDTGSYYKNKNDIIADDYIVFNRNNIKSADPVTYDENGDVIPLSERFNEENEDIRYHSRYDNINLNTLEDNELQVYNNRGWSDGLFTDEERKLLQEKFNELNTKTRQRTDNVLGDGSRIVEINNKLVLIDGTFDEPIIHDVLFINADNETYAEVIKGDFLYDTEDFINDKESYEYFSKIEQEVYGDECVRFFVADDYFYQRGREDTGERAVLPDSFKSYGYTKQFTERTGDNQEAERDISTNSQVGEKLYQARPDFDDFIFDDFDGEVTDNVARLMTEYLRQGKTDIFV